MFAETMADHGAARDCFVYCGVNTHWEERTMELPVIPQGMKWTKVAYTPEDTVGGNTIVEGSITLAPRSLMVLLAE